MGKRILHQLGISNFVYKEFRKEPKGIVEAASSIPLFTLEVLFAQAHAFARTVRRWTKPVSTHG